MKRYIELLKLLKQEVQNNNGETFNLKLKFFHYGYFTLLKTLVATEKETNESLEAYKLIAEIEAELNYIV